MPVLAVPASFSDHGNGVTLSGTALASADLTIQIWNSPTGGTLVFEENFTGAIVNGSWNVQLNDSTLTGLKFGKKYYKDYQIDGTDLDFGSNERLAWYATL